MKANISHTKIPLKKRLVVFSSVAHHLTESGMVAHRGFVREIDIWGRIFEKVLVIARRGQGPTKADEVPYAENNIDIFCLPAPADTDGLLGKLKLMMYAPVWLWRSSRQLSDKDVLMARGPDSIGFLGWLLSRFNDLPRFAKYADQWDTFVGEPLGYRIQKMFYRSRNFGGPVMIYGKTDYSRPYLVPFFASGVSQEEWERAGKQVEQRPQPPPFRLLFVGRFVYFKGVDILLDALRFLNEKRDDLVLELVGDGPELPDIQGRIERYRLRNVELYGWLGPEELSKKFALAHMFIHPSRKEGFGKVLLEAMSYGLPIVGADVGVSRELVEKNHCGVLFQNEDTANLAKKISHLISLDAKRFEFSRNGRKISQTYVMENLEERYYQFVRENLRIS